jgi:hypothetical protein
MTTNKDYLFMNENIGKRCVISNDIGTLSEHIGYEGEELVITAVSDDGFYVLSSGHYCDENEVNLLIENYD